MDPSSSSSGKVNFYNVLKVPHNANLSQIKKARNDLALKMHGDKGGNDEVMKTINEAYRILSNPKLRSKYDLDRDDDDDTFDASVLSGFLHVGRKLSDEFMEKINFWKKIGPAQDKTSFRDPNAVKEVVLKSANNNSAIDDCKQLLKSTVLPIQKILSAILSKEIWNWSFTKITIPNKDILNSSLWSAELPPETADTKPIMTDYSQQVEDANALINAPVWNYVFPDVRVIKQEVFNHYHVTSAKILPSKDRRQAGTLVPLCPNTPALQSELGYIPQHSVGLNGVTLQTDAANCSDCQKPFGLFLWKSNCMVCGNANCNDCLKVRNLPDYVDPVQVCPCCEKNHQKTYSSSWVTALDNLRVRQIVTGKYLALIDELGYADRAGFQRWANLFFDEGRYDLAMQCTYSGNGDWMVLAAKMTKKQQFGAAKGCLSLIQNQSKEWWIGHGDACANENPNLALLCYQKAGLSAQDYIGKALRFCNQWVGKSCLIVAAKESKNERDFFNSVYNQAIAYKKYGIALFCAIQGNWTLKKWLEIINQVDIQYVESFIHRFNTLFKCDWKNMRFSAARDHLRWQFLGKPNFKEWLGYLEELLKQDSGENSIPFFRSKMRKENFISHRDDFLASGDYSKMLLCHRLAPNSLSWEDLAQKIRGKNESASLAAYSCASENIESTGDKLFNTGHISMSLHCYMQAGNLRKIQELSKKVDPQSRLLFQLALWKNEPSNRDFILDICRTLLMHAVNAKSVQNIVIACLKNLKPEESLPFYKLLIDSGISNKELLGLLEMISLLPLNSNDKAWHEQTLSSFQTKFKTALYLAIHHCSLKETFTLIDLFHPLTLSTLQSLLKEFKIDQLPRGPTKSVCLVVKSLSNLIHPTATKLMEAMNDLTEAMLGDPSEDSMHFYMQVANKISSYTTSDWKLRGKKMTTVKAPEKSEFIDRLQRTPDLKMLIRSEEAIAKFTPLTASMSYIDLCMAIGNAPGLVGGFLSAALSLLKAMQEIKSNPNDCFAYRRAIVELVTTAYTIGHMRLCPATRLYALRSSIAILTAAFNQSQTINAHDQMVIEVLYEEADKLSKVAPVIMDRLVQIYDLIYIDCVYRELMGSYLDHRRKSDSNPVFQYYMLEGSLEGWLDEEKFKFEDERVNTMQALLQQAGNTMDDVEGLMSWPAIKRDSDGWLPTQPTPLKLNNKKYAHVNGIRFNMDTGEISLLLEESNKPMESLFDTNDITDIMKLGVGGAQFTLDPPDPDMPFHPFQKMLFAPDCLEGTNYLATMLHADMLMKWLSQLTEVSGMAPFALRDAEEGLLKRLPEDLRQKFTVLRENLPQSAGKIHRFWIQAGDLPYFQTQNGNEVTFTFGKCNMSVKKHLMVRDRHGNLEDTDKDEETDSREAKFAKLMTDEYDNLGKYFPELARLEELVKLQALSNIAQNIFENVQNMSAKINVSREKIEDTLRDIRSQIKYPQSNNVETILNDTISQSGYRRSQVPSSQLSKLRTDILNKCKEADNNCIDQIVTLLNNNFKAYYLEDKVKYWLNSYDSYDLISTLKHSLEQHEKQKILLICDTFKKYGIATQLNTTSVQSKCSWVPAAFKRKDHSFVYGGVNMNARMIPGGAAERSMGMNSLPPRGGSVPGGPNSRPYYVEGMQNGRLYGTMTAVDRVTGNTYRVLDVGSCIRDQYNQNSSYPNTSALWRTYVGYTDVHHYSRHINGATHFHYTSGWTNCTTANGTTPYRSGDRTHNCNT